MEKFYKNLNNETFCFNENINPYEWGHRKDSLIEITKEEAENIEKSKLPPIIGSEEWIEGATLQEVQEFKRLELKNARDTEILSHYLYTNNHIYDADLDSRNRLFQAQQLGAGLESSINWVTADNQISSVNNQDLNNIVNGIAYREQLAFNKFSVKYTEVLNCTNIDDVKNIKY